MKRKIWTAAVFHHFTNTWLVAQEKSSKANLKRRLEADDPIWPDRIVIYFRCPMFDKKHFRRGLAIVCKDSI
jgi:hypothetical protein